jgi:hypothetical protein
MNQIFGQNKINRNCRTFGFSQVFSRYGDFPGTTLNYWTVSIFAQNKKYVGWKRVIPIGTGTVRDCA